MIEANRVVLERRDARVNFLTPLHQRGAVSDVEISDERLLRDEVRKRVAENQTALKDAEEKYQTAAERLKQLPPLVLAEVKQLLAPVEAAIGVQEANIRQIELEKDWLEVRAPIAGTIVAIHRHPGQSVRAGDPIVTIAAEQGRYIVGYVPQENRFRPEVGMAVEVRPRLPGSRPREGVVERVGPQVELIPVHQRRSRPGDGMGAAGADHLAGRARCAPRRVGGRRLRTPPPPRRRVASRASYAGSERQATGPRPRGLGQSLSTRRPTRRGRRV